MTTAFEAQKNRKAFTYTLMICGGLLLLFILISWKVMPPSPPVVQDQIEINLGNNDEGFGKIQPLIKGERSPEKPQASVAKPAPAKELAAEEKITPDDNAEENSAAVTKTEKKSVKTTAPPTPAPTPAPPKPQKPKFVYNGVGKGNGNNPTQDNGYTMQGNKPGGKGDYGVPNGDKDSYGNTPGGAHGGPKVISGNRSVIRYYSFSGDLPKATINAFIKVSPEGIGTFSGFAKGSTQTSGAYANAIAGYLRNIQFNKASDESIVTVQFNFTVQ